MRRIKSHSAGNANNGNGNLLRNPYLGENQIGVAPNSQNLDCKAFSAGSGIDAPINSARLSQNGLNIVNINGMNNCVDQNLNQKAFDSEEANKSAESQWSQQDGSIL